MQGSGRGKACVACVKGQAALRGFLGEEKWPVAESVGLGEVMAILWDAVEVLRGIRLGMRSLEEAIDGHYAPVESDGESKGEEVEEAELVEELVGLSEEATEYCAFWRLKHGREYRAMVPGKDGKNVEEEMEVEGEKEKEKEMGEMKGMRWRWMGWSWARQGLWTKKLFYLLLLFVLSLSFCLYSFCNGFFLFCFY
jgi:hypothetical protein